MSDEDDGVGTGGVALVDEGTETIDGRGEVERLHHVVCACHEEDHVGAGGEGEVGVGGYLGDDGAGVTFVEIIGHVARLD